MNDYANLIKRLGKVIERAGYSPSWVRADVTEAIETIQALSVANRMQKVEIDRLNYVLEGVSPMPMPHSLGPRHTLYFSRDGSVTLEDTNNSDIMSLDECNIGLLAELLQAHAKEHGANEVWGVVRSDDKSEPRFIWEDTYGYRVRVLSQVGNIVYYEKLGEPETHKLTEREFMARYARMENPQEN